MKHPHISSLGLVVLAGVSLSTPAFAATIYTLGLYGAFGTVDSVSGAYTPIKSIIPPGGHVRTRQPLSPSTILYLLSAIHPHGVQSSVRNGEAGRPALL